MHQGETRAVEKDIPVVLNDGKVLPSGQEGEEVSRTVVDKKRYLMKKIDRLDRTRKY